MVTDEEIISAIPSRYLKYDICIKDRETCELFIKLNGEEWRKAAELMLKQVEALNARNKTHD